MFFLFWNVIVGVFISIVVVFKVVIKCFIVFFLVDVVDVKLVCFEGIVKLIDL